MPVRLAMHSATGRLCRKKHPAHDSRADQPYASLCPIETAARSSPSRQISDLQKFPLTPPPNHQYIPRPSRPTKRGVGHRHERGTGCGGRGSVGRVSRSQGGLIVRERTQRVDDRRRSPAKAGALRTAKPCGPGTRCWCQAGGGASTQPGPNNPSIRRRRRQKRIRLRGEPGISRKTIAQGMSDALRCPVCSCASHHSFAHETAGAARTRHSLRPPASRGAELAVKLRAPRAARSPRHCERSEAIHPSAC